MDFIIKTKLIIVITVLKLIMVNFHVHCNSKHFNGAQNFQPITKDNYWKKEK